MNFCFRKYFQFLLHILIWFPSIINSQPNFFSYSCMDDYGNYSKNSLYETNLKGLLNSLSSGMDNYGFNSSSFGPSPNTVYAISLCRGDVQIDTCRDCVHDAISALPQICPNSKQAIGWYDNCMLRYSNMSISGKLQSSPTSYASNSFNVSSKVQFNEALETLLSGLRESASNGGVHKKYATNHTIGPDNLTIYGLMQCTPDLSIQDCDSCLSTSAPDSVNNALSSKCNGKKGCRVLKPSCSMRYEISQFYSETSSPPPSNSSTNTPSARPAPPMHSSPGKDGNAAQTAIIIVTSIVGFEIVLILCIGIFLKKKKHKKSRQSAGSMDDSSNNLDISSIDSLQFDFGITSDATNNFSQTNKLGGGGFGAVYRARFKEQEEMIRKMREENDHMRESMRAEIARRKAETVMLLRRLHRTDQQFSYMQESMNTLFQQFGARPPPLPSPESPTKDFISSFFDNLPPQ